MKRDQKSHGHKKRRERERGNNSSLRKAEYFLAWFWCERFVKNEGRNDTESRQCIYRPFPLCLTVACINEPLSTRPCLYSLFTGCILIEHSYSASQGVFPMMCLCAYHSSTADSDAEWETKRCFDSKTTHRLWHVRNLWRINYQMNEKDKLTKLFDACFACHCYRPTCLLHKSVPQLKTCYINSHEIVPLHVAL